MSVNFEQHDFLCILEIDSPILLTIPHDGFNANDFDGFFERRSSKHVLEKDARAWHIARHINLNGEKPVANMVRGLLPRPMVDYNRSVLDGAFQDSALLSYYYIYHAQIKRLIKRSLAEYGRCLLLDIHGFVNQPDFGEFDVILGTQHRTTVVSDVDIEFAAFLRDKGYNVYLPTEGKIKSEKFGGGFTVVKYSRLGIDAMQVEIAKEFRVKNANKRKKLTRNIREFLEGYKNSI